MVLAALSFAAMGVLVKASVESLPFLVAVFFRAFIGFVTLLAYFKVTGAPLAARQHGLLLLRSVFGFVALTMYFFALERLPLSNATVLNFSSPVFVVILSGFILHERHSPVILPLVLAAFCGAALLVTPDFMSVSYEAVLGLLSAVFAAMAYIAVRRLARTESSATIVLYFSMYASVFALATLGVAIATGYGELGLDRIASVISEPKELLLLLGVGLTATLGQICLTSAYARERASVVSGFSYITPLVSYVLGLALFDEVPTAASLAGGLIVIGASLGILYVSSEPARTPTHPE